MRSKRPLKPPSLSPSWSYGFAISIVAVGLQLPSALHNKSLPNEAACLSLPVCPHAALWEQLSSLPITHWFNASLGFCVPCCVVSLISYSDLTDFFSSEGLKLMVYGWEIKINKYSISERNTAPLGPSSASTGM